MGAPVSAGALFFALTVAFWPGIAGAATAPRWALLSVAVPYALAWTGRRLYAERLTVGHAFGVAFLAWGALSLAWSEDPWNGLNVLWKFCLLAGLFVLGARLPSLRPVWIGAGLGMAINGVLVTAQWLGWNAVPQVIPPAGLFANKNFVAEAAALVLIGLIGARLWWLLPLVLPCVALTGARGALLAIVAAGAAWLWPRSRLAAIAAALVILAAALIVGGYLTGMQRQAIWIATAHNLTPFGHGLGAFPPGHAHNDFLEAAYELGFGAVPLVALCAYALVGPYGTERFVFIAFAAMALVGFPSHLPVTAALGALAAGHLCRDRPHLRYHVARWRMAFRARLVRCHRGRGKISSARRRHGFPAQSAVSRCGGPD